MFYRWLVLALMVSSGLFAAATDNDLCKGANVYMGAPPTPKEALGRLIAGNRRYVEGKVEHPNRELEARQAVYCQQRPFAAILGCSDSRVGPEIIFDQGIGDIFVVRVAGNVGGASEIDSIEYAVAHLGASVVMVLGHERCGAVKALIDNNIGDIETVAALMKPALQGAKGQKGNQWDNVAKANVRQVVKTLQANPVLAPHIAKGKVQIVGGYYYLQSGKVEVLD